MDNTIPINGVTYSTGKLDGMTQFHVARRIAPMFTVMGLSLSGMAEQVKSMTNADEVWMKIFGAVSEVVAKMPEDDVNYVIKACLKVAKRQGADGQPWANVMANGQFMFADMDVNVILRLTVETIRENLGGFFPMLPGGPA